MITSDAGKQRKAERNTFKKPRETERWYAARLREIARHVGQIIRGFPAGDPASLGPINIALNAYAEAIDPWARATAARMLVDVSRRDKKAWDTLSRLVGKTLANEIATTPIGEQMRALMAEQVALIKSLPIEAAQRVHMLTIEGISSSTRAREVAEMIRQSGDVSISRAMLIARTEVARTASTLTQARAAYVGSSGYIWRTSKDGSVRPSHRKMEGEFVRWDSKPVLDQMTGHAGEFPNCRCWPEVVLPDRFD
jgi:SPP1 gp7 family putative phage head morphogenesis protein